MKKYVFCILFIFIVLSCSTQKQEYNSKIYKKIYDCQGAGINFIDKSLNYYRLEGNYLNNFEYSKKNDTVYILEMYGVQGNVLFTIWNKNDTISYTNENGTLLKTKNRLFSKYMIQLVSEWNLSEIKKEEETNSNLLPSEMIHATIIVFNKGKYHIDCINFKNFFNLERDRD
jgi:hypothetical protein